MQPIVNPNAPVSWENPYGYWPCGLHWELLKAICQKDNKEALQIWRRERDIDAAPLGMSRLFPLLYRRLSDDDPGDPDLPRYKSTYRYTLYRNNLYFHRLRHAVESLEQAGIPVMFIKGSALAVGYYQDMGLRYMADFDITVPFESYQEAKKIVQANGFKEPFSLNASYWHMSRSRPFVDDEGFEFDLHWRVMNGYVKKDIPGVWDNTQYLNYRGYRMRIPCDEVNFIHCFKHGLSPNPNEPIRWVVDAIEILDKSTKPLNWDLIQTFYKDKDFENRFKNALRFIKVLRPDIDIPLKLDNSIPLMELKCHLEPKTKTGGLLAYLNARWRNLLSEGELDNPIKKLWYSRYCLHNYYNVENDWLLTKAVFQAILRRLKRKRIEAA